MGEITEQGENAVASAGQLRLELVDDALVVGVGVEPSVEFLAGSGVEIDNGILVDEYCRTNVDGIYAAGDVANHYHPSLRKRMRVEHWQNAMQQGAAAARSMIGAGQPYDAIHWFWSDQYETNLQYAGFHHEWDRLVVRGSLPGLRESPPQLLTQLGGTGTVADLVLDAGGQPEGFGIDELRRAVDPANVETRALKLAAQAGLDPSSLTSIEPTGPGGRVSGDDITRHLAARRR